MANKELQKEMQEAINSGSQIGKELTSTFSDEERIANTIGLDSESFNIKFKSVPLNSIAPLLPLKESRKRTFKGLGQSVRELGVLTPIHVMQSENYKQFLSQGKREEDWNRNELGDRYILIDGFRRVWSALENKLDSIPAIVWDFKNMDQAMDLILPLSLMLNRHTRRNIEETWGLFQILEENSALSPSTLEYLLQLDSGDAMKLRDVMMSDYPEVITDLLNGKKNLQQSYNALNKLRKEEDDLSLEDKRGLSEIEASQGIISESAENGEQRSYQEIKDILDISDEEVDEMSEDDFVDLAGAENEGVVINRRKGEDIPRELKQAALARDNFTCQVSGTGLDTNLPMTMGLSVLQVHHIIPLYLGGKNTLENLITLRMDIHTWVHVVERLGGKIGMSKDTFDNLDPHEKRNLNGALKLGKKIVDEAERQGKSITDRKLQQASYKASQFKFPGTDLKSNIAALENLETGD